MLPDSLWAAANLAELAWHIAEVEGDAWDTLYAGGSRLYPLGLASHFTPPPLPFAVLDRHGAQEDVQERRRQARRPPPEGGQGRRRQGRGHGRRGRELQRQGEARSCSCS